LYDPEFDTTFMEGVHYSIMFYGGANLANVSFEAEGGTGELVDLLRMNRNAVVVIDKDGKSVSSKLRDYKKRIQKEIGKDRCWITSGREIENYLRAELIQQFLGSRCKKLRQVSFGRFDRIQETIDAAVSGSRVRYDKVRDSKRLSELMQDLDLNVLDLRRWVSRVHQAIRGWN
jgi:hypothetical protein